MTARLCSSVTRVCSRIFSRIAGVALAAGVALSATGTSISIPVPIEPTDPAVAHQWVNPAARPGEADSEIDVILESVDSDPVAGQPLKAEVTIRNSSTQTVGPLSLSVRRADAVYSPAEISALMAAHHSTFGYFGLIKDLNPLAPGEEKRLTLNIPTAVGEEGSLWIANAGVYPLMFSLGDASDTLTTERTVLTFRGEDSAEPEQPTDMTMLLPLTTPVDIVPGETGTAPEEPPLLLLSERVAEEIEPQGRLGQLLSHYSRFVQENPDAAQGTCLSVDPALVEVVDRMSRGYLISSQRPTEEGPQRLRDSWFQSWTKKGRETVQPGRAAEDAQRWIEQLKAIAAQHCIISMPWGNTDIRAVAATGNQWLTREALERGPFVLEEILGQPGVRNTVIAPGGYINQASLSALPWANHINSPLNTADMSQVWESTTTPTVPFDPQSDVRVIVAANTVAGHGTIRPLGPGTTAVTTPSTMSALLATTGPAPHTPGYSNPDNRYDYRVDSEPARAHTASAALRTQATSGVEVEDSRAIAVLPTSVDPESADTLLAEYAQLNAERLISATPLIDAIAGEPAPNQPEDPRPGSPYPDASITTETEITEISSNAQYLDDLTRIMINDPAITLSRYNYTLPLRQELIRALGLHRRNTLEGYQPSVYATRQELDKHREILQGIQASISLVPPGNVYTRSSQSSPLLIVAANGLPLPVKADINFESNPPGQLNAPNPIRVPAQGSVTVEMTASLSEEDQSVMTLWLANLDGAAISKSVEVVVQTRTGTSAVLALGIGLLVVLLGWFIRRGRRKRKTGGKHHLAQGASSSNVK